ncbi:helix-turn-helix domain-containing protein [Pontivivens ytuae]|uniref:Helix-turn-helix domain-containing protein n=1 Tax=Pontivivens ytuae TaxID=2789856 RepID=A0A7S9LRF3_9RHOB|nr:helix-turn-helix domain-containing protein [Pontivivens ytuae]QPH53919.1 helix-turn-helix domain-containing protein [Pontivivens ytuae]
MQDESSSPTQDYYHEDTATFGDRMAAAREALGLDRNALARRLGVRPATIENWEDDRAEPRANRAQMLAGVLGVSLTWLLSGQGDGIVSDEGEGGAEVAPLLAELRSLRAEQLRISERMALIEKRLRRALV